MEIIWDGKELFSSVEKGSPHKMSQRENENWGNRCHVETNVVELCSEQKQGSGVIWSQVGKDTVKGGTH